MASWPGRTGLPRTGADRKETDVAPLVQGRIVYCQVADPQGRTRLRMLVDSLGNPRVEFLNDSGRVVMKIPAGG